MKQVLFLCVANMCRSQMAEGFACALGRDVIQSYSAGSRPGHNIHPMSISAMREVGIDIAEAVPKGLQDLPIDHFDIVVSLCQDSCPRAMATEHRQWNVGNPDGLNIQQFKSVRDHIRTNVEALIEELRQAEARGV